MDQNLILYFASFLTAILGLVIGIVAYSYRQLIKKYYLLKEESDRASREAQLEAQKIIDKASERSQKIISDAESFNKILREDFARQLEDVRKAHAANYQQILDTIHKESINMLGNISNDIKSQVTIQIGEFINSLQKEILKSQESVITMMKVEYQKALEDIKTYKNEMYTQIDSSIINILQNVSSKVLGKAINLEEHEELVIKALTNAKRREIL